MSTMTLIQTNGSKPAVTPPAPPATSQTWLRSSVHEFFAAFNWEDHSPEVQEIILTAVQGNGVPLSLTLSVSQFFGAISWEGQAIAPAPVEPLETSLENDSFTLEDFSDLF